MYHYELYDIYDIYLFNVTNQCSTAYNSGDRPIVINMVLESLRRLAHSCVVREIGIVRDTALVAPLEISVVRHRLCADLLYATYLALDTVVIPLENFLPFFGI